MSKDSHGATEMSVRTVVVAGSAELAAELKDAAGPGNSAVTGAAISEGISLQWWHLAQDRGSQAFPMPPRSLRVRAETTF